MKSTASIKGHPIHPIMVALPIGLLTMSLVSDLVYLGLRTAFWYDMAWWTMAFGVFTGLLAGIPGYIDYRTTVQRVGAARPTALVHMWLNVGVLTLYAINLYLRHDYMASGGGMLAFTVLLSVVSFATLGASGWLGGELAYRFGIGVHGSESDMRITMLDAERELAERTDR